MQTNINLYWTNNDYMRIMQKIQFRSSCSAYCYTNIWLFIFDTVFHNCSNLFYVTILWPQYLHWSPMFHWCTASCINYQMLIIDWYLQALTFDSSFSNVVDLTSIFPLLLTFCKRQLTTISAWQAYVWLLHVSMYCGITNPHTLLIRPSVVL